MDGEKLAKIKEYLSIDLIKSYKNIAIAHLIDNITINEKERFVNDVTRRMLEIMENRREQENSKSKGLDKNGKTRYNPVQGLGKGES